MSSLVPDPGYPVYSAGGIIAGREDSLHAPAGRKRFPADLESIPEEIARRAKIYVAQLPQQPHRCGCSAVFL